MTHIPLSILDLAVVVEGSSIRQTIARSKELAVSAEELGYKRFWMAEHHSMEHIASSATSLLLGHIAEATSKIRVGSGGIMLPNHSPLIIAEQFGTLATLYPDRVDLGLGRAPGTDPETAQAIRPDRISEIHRFPENVRLLQRYFSDETKNSKVRAIPGEGTNVPIWILGSSTDSAYLAAEFGLPYAFASHFAPQQLMTASQIYRSRFKPSNQLQEPRFMPCINVIAADTDEEAQFLSTSMMQMFMGVITGKSRPMPKPVRDMSTVWTPHQEVAIRHMLSCSFVGSRKTVTTQIAAFIEQTDADELMIATYMHDFQLRLKSVRLLMEWIQQEQTQDDSGEPRATPAALTSS